MSVAVADLSPYVTVICVVPIPMAVTHAVPSSLGTTSATEGSLTVHTTAAFGITLKV